MEAAQDASAEDRSARSCQPQPSILGLPGESDPELQHTGDARASDVPRKEWARHFPHLPLSLKRRLQWALQTAVATLAISSWCLRQETHELLPTPSFGAYVTIFLTGKTFGATLRLSADSLFGAATAVTLAWPLAAYMHASSPVLTGLFLFLQSFFWAYLELPVPTRRLALSTMVITCLSALRQPDGATLRDAVGLVLLVALSAVIAHLSVLLPLGPQCAGCRALAARASAAQVVRLLIDKSVGAFLEAAGRRRHIAVVQLGELSRAAHSGMAALSENLEEARWEPRLPWIGAGADPCLLQDKQSLEKMLLLLDSMQRALLTLPFNPCHHAFVARLERPMVSLAAAASRLVPPVDEDSAREAGQAEKDVEDFLKELHGVYGRARRELLYPPGSRAKDVPAAGLRQAVNWTMEDLLHINTFLFTTMHLAAEILSDHRKRRAARQAPCCPCCGPWKAHVLSLMKAFAPWSWTPGLRRFRGAFRFAVAIELAAVVSLIPSLHTKFALEIWGPVEVTFLMFKYAGGSLRQSILRLEGALLGSVVGYVCVLGFEGSQAGLLACLTMWGFVTALFRGSASHSYAAIVAAWTAVIVVDVGLYLRLSPGDDTPPSSGAAVAALERISHTVIGVAALVVGINLVFPEWARDAARTEVSKVLGLVEQMYATLQGTWLRQSKQMALYDDGDEDQESAGLVASALRAAGGEDGASSGEDLRQLHAKIRASISALQGLMAEAAVEPVLWRAAYPADAAKEVVRSLLQMLSWLQMFHTYMYEVMVEELKRVFNAQEPQRWLSREWVWSLRDASEEIANVLGGLRGSLPAGQSRGDSAQPCEGEREQLYFGAIHVERLEHGLRQRLREFLQNYDRILVGTISDSQLKILAGTQSEQFLTNLDMLLYNSSVFAMKGFVEQVLSCSRAIRNFIISDAGACDAMDVVGIGAVTASFAGVEAATPRVRPQAPSSPEPCSPTASRAPLRERASPPKERYRAEAGAESASAHALTILGPGRPGIICEIARTVGGHGGSVGALRMVELDCVLAVVAQVELPPSRAPRLEVDLRGALRGFEISLGASTTGVEGGAAASSQSCLYEADVRCVCPGAAQGLAEQFVSVLSDGGFDIVSLSAEPLATSTGAGLLLQGRIGARRPIDEAILQERVQVLQQARPPGGAPLQLKWTLLHACERHE